MRVWGVLIFFFFNLSLCFFISFASFLFSLFSFFSFCKVVNCNQSTNSTFLSQRYAVSLIAIRRFSLSRPPRLSPQRA